jgi:trehalose 6-phosphate phosphatase
MDCVEANQIPDFAADWVLFLDVDGTLLELADRPDAVHVSPRLVDLLGELDHQTNHGVVLVSGRSVSHLDRLFEPLRLPAAGLHGSERRDLAGNYVTSEANGATMDLARERLAEIVVKYPGLFFEDKGLAIALHYRREPELGPMVHQMFTDIAAELGSDYRLQEGKAVVELTAARHSKGSAIETFMDEPSIRDRVPVMVGDDVTDESGFEVVNRLRGVSLKVGDGATAARYRLPSPAAVRHWLSDYLVYLREQI